MYLNRDYAPSYIYFDWLLDWLIDWSCRSPSGSLDQFSNSFKPFFYLSRVILKGYGASQNVFRSGYPKARLAFSIVFSWFLIIIPKTLNTISDTFFRHYFWKPFLLPLNLKCLMYDLSHLYWLLTLDYNQEYFKCSSLRLTLVVVAKFTLWKWHFRCFFFFSHTTDPRFNAVLQQHSGHWRWHVFWWRGEKHQLHSIMLHELEWKSLPSPGGGTKTGSSHLTDPILIWCAVAARPATISHDTSSPRMERRI